MPPPSILWLRRDLRRGDLPALGAAHDAATADGGQGEVAVVFVLDPPLWEGGGDARRAWLAESIKAADAAYDGRLCVREGDPETVVPALAAELGAGSVHVSRETTPAGAAVTAGSLPRSARRASTGSRPAPRMPWGRVR